MKRSPWHRLTLVRRGSMAVTASLAALSLAACGDDPVSPPTSVEVAFAEVDGQASGASAHRPFKYSQQWDASGNDFTNACIAEIPDPTTPGGSIQVPFPGVARGWGTATHWGRHAVEIYIVSCVWDAEVGALAVRGPANSVVASGDTIWVDYEGYWYLSPSGGGDFIGSMVMVAGTGRFQNVAGEASLYAHDEPDSSGWDWGSGWIAY